MRISLLIFEVPFVEINIEDDDGAGFQAAENETLIC
jgi:hypothetical protein